MNIINFELLVLDYIVLSLSLVFIIISFWKGFINSILGLLTWVGSVFITIYTFEYLSNYLNGLLISFEIFSGFDQFISILSNFISIPIIFLISLFILKKIRKAVSGDLDKKILGLIIDKLFGIIYGFIFSYIFYSTALYLTVNANINLLDNLNNILNNNSNILKKISENNNIIIKNYINKEIE